MLPLYFSSHPLSLPLRFLVFPLRFSSISALNSIFVLFRLECNSIKSGNELTPAYHGLYPDDVLISAVLPDAYANFSP
jgi:hypothetical protein